MYEDVSATICTCLAHEYSFSSEILIRSLSYALYQTGVREDALPNFDAWCSMMNKAIRDGKYLARHMPVLGNVHPIKIENVDIFFRDVISLLARVVILLIDTATQEVPMKNI